MRGRVDMHLHTRGSDGWGSAEDIVEIALSRGLHGFAITDHHKTRTLEGDRVQVLAENSGLVVYRGAEYSSADGHVLIYGVALEDLNLGYYAPAQAVIDVTRRAGGVAIPAHPYHGYRKEALQGRVIGLTGIPAIETRNGQREVIFPRDNELAVQAARARRHGRRSIGGSDAHDPRYVGSCLTVFDRLPQTDRELVQILLRGNYRAARSIPVIEALRQRRQWQPSVPSLDVVRPRGETILHGTKIQPIYGSSVYTSASPPETDSGSKTRH